MNQSWHKQHDREGSAQWPLLVIITLLVMVLALLAFSAQCRGQIMGTSSSTAEPRPYKPLTVVQLDPGVPEGYLRSSPALTYTKARVARLSVSDLPNRTLESDPDDIPWEGINILQDWTVLMLDPEFGATFRSVMEQEGGWDAGVVPIQVNGAWYDQLG